jgi:hypothetical protein
MANDFTMGFKTPGFDDVLGKFDKLTKKEQEAIAKGSKLGKMFQDVGKKGKRSGDTMAQGMKNFAASVAASITVTGLLQKGIQALGREYEKFKQQALKGQELGLTVKEAKGKLIRNAAGISPAELKRILDFSKRRGADLGPGGEARVIGAFETARSALGPAATEKELFSAINRGINASRVDSTVDIAQNAISIIRLMKSLNIGEKQAGNTALTFGKFAGGDINQFIPQIGKLTGLQKSGGFKGDINDILAFEGFLSQKLSLSPEEATTIVGGTLGKLSLQAPRVKGKPIDFKAENTLDQLIELFQRVDKGEFKNPKQILTEAGLRGALAAPVKGAILQDLGELQSARREIRKFNQPGAPDLLAQQERLLTKRDRAENQLRRTGGFVEGEQASDPELARRGRSLKEFKRLGELLGTSDPGGVGEFLSTKGDIGTARRAAEPGIDAFQQFRDLFFPPTQQQAENRKLFSKFIEETQGEGSSFQQWVMELNRMNDTIEKAINVKDSKVAPEGE